MRSFRVLRSLAFCGLVLLLVPAHGQEADVERTLLWRISGKGTAGPSFLYGTMHVSSKVAFHLTDSFFVALDQAEVVALELDPGKWLAELVHSPLLRMGALFNDDRGRGDLYGKGFQCEAPTMERLTAALSERPGMVDQLLYRFTEGYADHEENTFLDLFIYQCARKTGKTVVGLEDFEQVMGLVMRSEMPLTKAERKEQPEISELRQREFFEKHGAPQEAMEAAYRKGDLVRMDSLYHYMNPGERARRYMLDERNVIMAERMDAILQGKRMFTGVGAMHLPGKMGLIQLLRDRGYTVTPVVSSVTRKSIARREKLDETYVRLPYTRRTSSSGAWSMDLPGELHSLDIPGWTGALELNTDPVNGGYTSITTIPTFGLLRGRDRFAMADWVDSLLYECVPGRITSRSRAVDAEGMPTFDVVSVTRRGDGFHTRMVVTPVEIVVFTAGGKNTAAARKDRAVTMASVRSVRNGASGLLEPAMGGFSVRFPERRSVQERDWGMGAQGSGVLGRELVAQGWTPEGELRFALSSSYHDLDYIEVDTFELQRIAERFLDQFNMKAQHVEAGTLEGRPTLRSEAVNSAGDTVRVFTTLDGPHYHLLAATGQKAGVMEFFSSFRSKPRPAVVEPEHFVHDDLHFSVNVRTVQQKVLEESPEIVALVREASERMKDEELWYAHHQSATYASTVSPERVAVSYDRLNPFREQKPEEERFDKYLERMANRIDGTITRRSFNGQEATWTGTALVTRPGSSRGVALKMVRRPGTMHTLSAVVDTIAGPGAYVSDFFEHFSPTADSLVICCEDPGALFFNSLAGTDSLMRERALDGVARVHLEKAHLPRLLEFLRSEMYDTLGTDLRRSFLRRMAELAGPEDGKALREHYIANSDTAGHQLAMLEALAAQHDTGASRLFIELLAADPPLTDDQDDIAEIFLPFHDSLATALPLFPKVLDLLRFPEYSAPVYRLMARLVDEGALRSTIYARERDRLVMDAQAELKRSGSPDKRNANNWRYRSAHNDRVPRRTLEDLDRLSKRDLEEEEETGAYTASTGVLNAQLRVLLPWYAEPAVQPLFAKALVSSNDGVVLRTAMDLLQAGHPVDSAVWSGLAAKVGTRLELYRALAAAGRTDLMPDRHRTVDAMALAVLRSGHTTESKAVYTFLEEREVANKFGSGRVRFYSVKDSDEDKEKYKLACVGFLPADTTLVEARPLFHELQRNTYLGGELTKGIDVAVERVEDAGRRRVRRKNGYGFGYEDWY